MIHRKAIDNLIAQTNYLSSMYQTYHDVLLKQSHSANEESESFQSEKESIFESQQSQNDIQAQNFLSNERDFNMSSPYLNQLSYHDDLLENQIHDRPTGYMRDQEKNQINEKILSVEKSIELCFKAIESQLQIRTKLREKGMLISKGKEKSKAISRKLKNEKKALKSFNNSKSQSDKLKAK